MAESIGLVQVKTAGELGEEQEQEVLGEQRAAEGADTNAELIGNLDAHLSTLWEAAKNAKMDVEKEMLDDLRQREGVYTPEKLAAIRESGGSEIYMMLTNMKCRAAESWLTDIMFPAGSRPFTVSATPEPSMPPPMMQQVAQLVSQEAQEAIQSGLYVTQEQVFQRAYSIGTQIKQRMTDLANQRARGMEDAIDDLFEQGDWYPAMRDFIADLVTLPCGILKGPVVRKKRALKWVQYNGTWVPQAIDELRPCWYAVSPFDYYPSPDSRAPGDGFDFERMPIRRDDLYRMIGVDGYSEDRIRAALDEYDRGGFDLNITGDQQRRELEKNRQWYNSPDKPLDVLIFNGTVRGEWLINWGMDPSGVPDDDAEYQVEAWKVGRFVVRCVLNEDPLRRSPYMLASYDSVRGQIWGRGLPRTIKDLADVCNACGRNVVNNMGLSSGPLVEVEVDRLAPGEKITSIYPWKIYQTKSGHTNSPSPAVRFNQPKSVVSELLEVYKYFSGLADIYSGIPSYEHGVNPTTGAAGTASGLSMLMTAASRQIKRVAADIDHVIEGCCQRAYSYLMLWGQDDSIKGDCDIVARGVTSLIAREQQTVRRQQFLQATANPLDSQIIGPLGRRELLSKQIADLDVDPSKVLPSEDELLARIRAAQMPPGAVQAHAPSTSAAASQDAQVPPPGAPTPPPNAPHVPPPQTVLGSQGGGASHALFAQR